MHINLVHCLPIQQQQLIIFLFNHFKHIFKWLSLPDDGTKKLPITIIIRDQHSFIVFFLISSLHHVGVVISDHVYVSFSLFLSLSNNYRHIIFNLVLNLLLHPSTIYWFHHHFAQSMQKYKWNKKRMEAKEVMLVSLVVLMAIFLKKRYSCWCWVYYISQIDNYTLIHNIKTTRVAVQPLFISKKWRRWIRRS